MVVVNFYFVHAKWLIDRQRVIDEFTKQIKKYQFRSIQIGTIMTINEMDPNDIPAHIMQQYVSYAQLPDNHPYNGFLKNMHVFQLSNVLKHLRAIELISKSTNDTDVHIVLEDDIIYENRLCLLLESLVRRLPTSYDFIFLGLPTNKNANNLHDVHFQNTSELFKVLPYCDSYVLSNNAAKKMLETFMPIKFMTNIQLSYLIEKLNFKPQLAYPNIFMDGSKIGNFISYLNPNNTLMFNNDYMNVKNLISKETLISPEEEQAVEKIIANSPISNHPDFSYLKAKYLQRKGLHNEAKNVFEKTYHTYKNAKCILNHESVFLKDYIKHFKYLQTDI